MSDPIVQFVKRKAIDAAKWDATVATDSSRLPYGYTWWLDAVTDERWHAVILDDYRAVLPLPYSRTFGIPRVTRAPFTQQYGPWGECSPAELTTLILAIPRRYPQVDLPLRELPESPKSVAGHTYRQRTNMVLDLSQGYDTAKKGFSRSHRRYLKNSGEGSLRPVSPEEVIANYRAGAGVKARLTSEHYQTLRTLIAAVEERKLGKCVGYFSADGAYLASGFFPKHQNRLINLFADSTIAGYRERGMLKLLGKLMEGHAGPDALFDFEGSDLPGVSDFFRAFGPVERSYYHVLRSWF